MKVSDVNAADSVEGNAQQFRRRSIQLGLPPPVSALAPGTGLKRTTTGNVAEATITSAASSFFDHCSAKGNVARNIDLWYDSTLPKDLTKEELEPLMKRILGEIGTRVKPLQKLGRIGLAARLSTVMILSYSDMGTDILVAAQFQGDGNQSWFLMSIGFVLIDDLSRYNCACTELERTV